MIKKEKIIELTPQSGVGLRKLSKDVGLLAKWGVRKYRERVPKYEISQKVITYYHPKTGKFLGEEHVGWLVVVNDVPMRQVFKTRGHAESYMRKLRG